MEYDFSWSELLLPPLEFDFGPKLAQISTSDIVVQYRNPANFQQASIQPLERPILPTIDLSSYIIQFAVTSAIFLKQSQIPDRITQVTEKAVEFSTVMEQHYAIKAKVKQVGHVFVNAFVTLFSTLIAALLQSMIAYHNTPSIAHNKRKQIENEKAVLVDFHDDFLLVTFCIGGNSFTTQLSHIVPRKKSLLGRLVFQRKSFDTAVFIDRDGTHFRHILNFLRGSDSISHIRDSSVLEDLIEEARYYELFDLEEKIMNVQMTLQEEVNLKKTS